MRIARRMLIVGMLVAALCMSIAPAGPANAYVLGVGHFDPPTGYWATSIRFSSSWVTPAISASNAWTNVSSCDFQWIRNQTMGQLFGNIVDAYNWGSAQLGLTSYEYDGTTIRKVKIRLNTHYTWAIDGRASAYDVQNALTHEFGHALPLGHSSYSAATMYAYASLGETIKRSLHSDDIAGIRAIY